MFGRTDITRARRYENNDQAHVEERNVSVVRRLIGYDRFDGLICISFIFFHFLTLTKY